MSEAAPWQDRRQHPRYRLDARARLRPNEWSSVQIELIDISGEGFRGNCDVNLNIGACVTLEVHGVGLVEARVVWRKGSEIGARFAHSIDLEHCGWFREPIARDQDAALPPSEETLADLLARRAARRAAL